MPLDIEASLIAYLGAYTGLTTVKVYPDSLPELGQTPITSGVFPAIVISRVSTVDVESHGGSSGLAEARFQFSAWGTTKTSAVAVRELLRAALQGFKGTMATGGASVGGVLSVGKRSAYEPLEKLYREDSDYKIWYAQS